MRPLVPWRHVLGAVLLLAATCPYLMIGVAPDGDANRFQWDGNAVVDGLFPYRDFYLEYPPGSIAIFALPSLLARSHWVAFYRFENAVGWALVIVLLSYIGTRRWPLYATALVPLALGSWTLMRLDSWPVVCVLGAVLAMRRERSTLALALLGVGTVVKSWPLALVPVFLLYRWSRRALLACAAIVVGTLLPFVIVTPVASYNAFRGQLDRHLQLETIGSSILLVLHRPVHTAFDAGSWNVFGPETGLVAKVQTTAQAVAILLVIFLFWRSRRTPHQFLAAVTATVAIFAFAGKILSPQYLLWVAPFAAFFPVIYVPLTVACLLTRELFPGHYQGLIDMHGKPVALLAVRNVFVVAALALALRAAWTELRGREQVAVAAPEAASG